MIIKTVGVIGQGFVGRALKEEFTGLRAIVVNIFINGMKWN